MLCFSGLAACIGIGTLVVGGTALVGGLDAFGRVCFLVLRVFFFFPQWLIRADNPFEDLTSWMIASLMWGLVFSALFWAVRKVRAGG